LLGLFLLEKIIRVLFEITHGKDIYQSQNRK